MTFLDNPVIEKGSKPHKKLTSANPSKGGRNNRGRTTMRFRGGGVKRKLRTIDFKRDKFGIEGKVETIQYDPNRSANIALICYLDGERRYILSPLGLKVGEKIMSGDEAPVRVGNFIPIRSIPLGTEVHNIELKPGRGGQMARSAGTFAQVLAKEGRYAQLRLPSGEIRLVRTNCMATIGRVGNVDHNNIVMGKAGRKRWLGIRPTVRGVAMNPVDHPMGGGEGRTSGGGHPKSPWGLLAKGKRTRDKHKSTNKYIVERRKK